MKFKFLVLMFPFLLQALMMGEPFFDCQIGFVGCRAVCLKGIMGIKDFEENMNRSETVSQNLPFPCFFWIECRDNEVLIEVFNHTKKSVRLHISLA